MTFPARRLSFPVGIATMFAVATCAVATCVPLVGAQATTPTSTLRVNPLRPLTFGQLISGIDGPVGADGGIGAAQFEVAGPPGATVQLIFTLSQELYGDNGARLPIVFGPRSASYSISQSGRDLVTFDPRVPFTLVIPPNGRLLVFVGGAAQPPRQITSGNYTGSLTLVARTVP
jgi:hypothetical protein